MNDAFTDLYEELYGRRPTEPKNETDAKNILECIRTCHGYLDNELEAELQQSSPLAYRKVKAIANKSRKVLAKFTKAISSQLYADPFRFFFELIQNADDAKYAEADENGAIIPCITFRVRHRELVVDLNEKGFSLIDVLTICDTGESSKKNDGETTGEKGFGFKAVFGIASEVHIQSGPWSFSFKHQRHEDGIGMISPIWRTATQLPREVGTRITLIFSDPEQEFLADLCARMESQPETIVSFLKKLRKIEIIFEHVLGRDYKKSFERVDTTHRGYREIKSINGSACKHHYYRSFAREVKGMPPREGRTKDVSTVGIWLPVSNFEDCEPEISSDGQFVSAFLPVCQIAQLPFLIQADFILPGSRQTVSDNAWNRKLRSGIAKCFGWAAALASSGQEYGRLRYQWLRFLPMSPITGFWQSLCELIREDLMRREPFLSRNGVSLGASEVRSLPVDFLHEGKPLLPSPAHDYSFLSGRYDDSLLPALRYVGVQELSSDEILNLLSIDLTKARPSIQERPLNNNWHNSFARLLETLLQQESAKASKRILEKLCRMRIIPVRDGKELAWRKPASATCTIYFPVVVEDGHGADRVQITIPTDLGLTVLHPAAASQTIRKQVYGLLGVQDCSPTEICSKIEAAQSLESRRETSDMVAHFELLFWFSHEMSTDQRAKLQADSAGNNYSSASGLFFQSPRKFDAALLGQLEATGKGRNQLLHPDYQQSTLSTRNRGGHSWESWLQDVAGIRWYPPLQDPATNGKLHCIITKVLKTNSMAFLPMLQAHWVEEYAETCRWNLKVKQALKKAKVVCRNGQKEELSKTWFPCHRIIDAARVYGVEDELPILELPNADRACELCDWSCLRDLDVQSATGLDFYRDLLLACSKSTPRSLAHMVDLYVNLGNSAGLNNSEELKTLFRSRKVVWDPEDKIWLSLDRCVWKSPITLRLKLVITAFYDEQRLIGLFKGLMGTLDIAVEDLFDELAHMAESCGHEQREEIQDRAAKIYKLLEDMSGTPESKQLLRSTFSTRKFVHCGDTWQTTDSCVWHESINIGQHTPIAALYPQLQPFFVDVLGVHTVTDVFLMDELAKEALHSAKNNDRLKSLMLSAAGMLNAKSEVSKFHGSLAVLQQAEFLPCRLPDETSEHLALDDAFFIVDNLEIADAFRGKLTFLDFTYEELNTLHTLLKLLQLESRYLSKNISFERDEGDSILDAGMTQQVQQCAYALSCCAVLHRSPRYFKRSSNTHDKLRNAKVYTSPNIGTSYVVKQNKRPVSAGANKAYLVVEERQDCLRIVLPENGKERKLCLRSQLPSSLVDFLQIQESNAEKQIYRFINEVDMGTDELLSDEAIPHVEWLLRTERVQLPGPRYEFATSTNGRLSDLQPLTGHGDQSSTTTVGSDEDELVVSSTQTRNRPYHRHQAYIQIPEEINHRQHAPDYHKVIAHVRSQTASVKWRNVPREETHTVRYQLTEFFRTLPFEGNELEAASRPTLFGSDALSNFRLGAAGELFVYEVLKSLTDVDITLNNWQSKIRHFVQAHAEYADVEPWRHPETADITYHDVSTMLESTLTTHVLGDSFSDWLPTWLRGECTCSAGEDPCHDRLCAAREANLEPLEWLFEVKTTTGPCETDFLMSPNQFNLMRELGTVEDHNRGKVYCLVRVYDLLTDRIGIRFYIDPWRFRESRLQFGTTHKWQVRAT